MSKPCIGITASRSHRNHYSPHQRLSENYLYVIQNAGGLPVIIPSCLQADDLKQAVGRLDGLLFSGGGDIHSKFYGGHPSITEKDIDIKRDEAEMELVRLACSKGLPFLGICRGIQIINVALDGTIYTDLQESGMTGVRHQYDSQTPKDFLAHNVQISGGSRLSQITKNSNITVNSDHHQGIDRLSCRLTASGFSQDGLVEAVELKNHPFGMGVQWHPECLPDDKITRTMMKVFISEADKYAKRKQTV